MCSTRIFSGAPQCRLSTALSRGSGLAHATAARRSRGVPAVDWRKAHKHRFCLRSLPLFTGIRLAIRNAYTGWHRGCLLSGRGWPVSKTSADRRRRPSIPISTSHRVRPTAKSTIDDRTSPLNVFQEAANDIGPCAGVQGRACRWGKRSGFS